MFFSAIHPAEKRLYANGDFEGVNRKIIFYDLMDYLLFIFQTPLHVSGCLDPRDVTRFDRSFYDLPVPKFKVTFQY